MALGTAAGTASTEPTVEWAGGETAPCVRPIDLVHLARYTMGNKALEREILDLFVDQSRLTLTRLEASATQKEWRDHAHALLGSARAVGAKRVAEHVLVAQKLPGACNDPGRPAALAAISKELEAANHYIREIFQEE